jgi:hypothetical protein
MFQGGNGANTHLWNVGILQRDYKALYFRRLSSSCSPPWEPEVSYTLDFPVNLEEQISNVNYFWKKEISLNTVCTIPNVGCSVILKKLIVVQLVKLSHFLRNGSKHSATGAYPESGKFGPLPAHHLSNVHFNIILQSTNISTTILYESSISSTQITCLVHPTFLDFVALIANIDYNKIITLLRTIHTHGYQPSWSVNISLCIH